jgi:acetyl esterase
VEPTRTLRPRRIVVALVGAATTALLFAGPAGAQNGSPTPSDAGPDAGITVTKDVVYRTVDGERLVLDAFVPATGPKHRPAIVMIHGGGWQGGDKSHFTPEGRRLAQLGYAAFSVNYRLAPANPFPAAVDDVQAAVRWLRAPAQVKAYGLDPKRFGALGGSAGGHLVTMLATLGDGSLTKGARIKAAVSWSGVYDFTAFDAVPLRLFGAGGLILGFLGCQPGEPDCRTVEREASPVSHVDASDAPMLLAHSLLEFVPINQATRMDDALKRAGVTEQLVVFPGTRHANALSADIWPETIAFFEQYVGKPPTTTGTS